MFCGVPSRGSEPATPQESGNVSHAHNGLCQSGIARRDIARRSERRGRSIRHAPLRTTLPVFPLTIAMVESTFRTVLIGDDLRAGVVGAGPGSDTQDCNTAGRDRRSDRCRKPRCTHGILAAEKQLRPDPPSRPPGGAGQGRQFMAR